MAIPIQLYSFYKKEGRPIAARLLLAGFVLWLIAYALIIWRSAVDRIHGVPIVAVCFNLTWEFLLGVQCPLCERSGGCAGSSAFCPQQVPVWERLALLAWLALDLVIVGQVVAWGAQGQLPVVQRHFGVILLAAMLITYVGQWTYMQSTEDIDGTRMAWLGNLVMSILFLLTALTRHPRVGLSYPAAWAKLLGSAFFAAAMIFARTIGTDSKQLSVQSRARVKPILFFLFATVLLFDSLYVYALRQL